jgi:triosephosphate isomerase
MIASVGAKYCIVGHSERRREQGESDALILRKARALLDSGITPIVCIGEDLEEREQGRAEERIEAQLRNSLLQMSMVEGSSCILAYEPVWAIGTGHTASPEQAQEMHATVRRRIADEWGTATAAEIPILYGGSCKSKNAAELFAQPDVDGGLIGGASLKADEFRSIIRSFH